MTTMMARDARKIGLDDDGHAFQQAFRMAVNMAIGERGVKMEVIAEEIDVSIHTLRAWMAAGREDVIPAHRLWKLIACGALPMAARRHLISTIARAGGFVAVAETRVERGGDVAGKFCEVSESVGSLAGAIRSSIEDGVVDDDEKESLRIRLAELEERVAELAVSLA